MATAGTLVYSTRLDTSGMDRGLKGMTGKVQGTGSTIKSILGGLGIAALVSKGIGAISSSMDGAIKRLDTMNNFPKVLQQFGVSADDASKSMDRIDKSVRGLPTSLDRAVAGVQNIFMVTKDLPKAEKMFQAINDSAMVFANGSQEAVDRFVYAYKQAMSAGKVSAQDFNQMNEAIPGVMDKVAEAMGMNFGQLKEGLSDGSISMEQFNKTLQLLDEKGVGAMTSMRDAAKTATGGIKTAITNMKTAITRGVANALDSLDKSLKDANLGGLSGVIASIGKAVESMLKKITPLISSTIKTLATIFSWMKKHEELVKILAVAIGSFIGTFMLIQKVIAIINAVKTAFAVLNAVMMANPISLIIAAVAALVAVFVYLWKHCEGFRNFWIGLWEGIKNIVVGAWEFLKGLFTGVIEFVKNNWKQILLFLVNPFAGAFALLYKHSTKFRNFINKIVNAVVGFFKSLPQKIKALPGKVWDILVSVVNKIITWRRNMINKGKEAAKGLFDAIVDKVKKLPSKMKDIGVNVAKGIGRGITNGVQWVKERIKEMVGNVTKFIKKLFKIKSPSKLMADEVGKWIPAGIGVGIEANTDSALKSIDEMSNEMIKKMQSAVNLETGRMMANASIKGNSFLNSTTVNSYVVADVYMDRTKVGQAVTPVVSQTLRKAGVA